MKSNTRREISVSIPIYLNVHKCYVTERPVLEILAADIGNQHLQTGSKCLLKIVFSMATVSYYAFENINRLVLEYQRVKKKLQDQF